jgi:hypothetical protein
MEIRKTVLSFEENENNNENDLKKFILKSFDITLICVNYVYKTIKIFINISGIYFVWIFLHYIASHLYIKFCVPSTIFGFLLSPFMTATPHCQGLRWVIINAANMINNMWVVLGAWICSTILIINKDTPRDTQS